MPATQDTKSPDAAEQAEEVGGELVTDEESRSLTQDIIMGRGEVAEGLDDPLRAQEAIVMRILSASSEEEILREDSTVATREMVGVPLEIRGARLMKSTLEGKAGGYLIIDAVVLDSGELVTLNTGAPKIMAQILRLEQIDRLPARVKVAEVGQAKPGQNRALQLVAA